MLYVVIALAALLCLIWAFGPREPVDLTPAFKAEQIGADVDAYFAAEEAKVPGITEGTEKRVIWHGERGAKTPLSLLYVHGFSATSEEIRPVPDRVAKALGANLVYTRLAGHGRDGDAMATATVGDWMFDAAEALEVARRVGDEVIVLSNSTGGTVTALSMLNPGATDRIKGLAFFSPNFAINNPASFLLTWPFARHWVPLIVGRERSFDPVSPAQDHFWTARYPMASVLPVAAAVKALKASDTSGLSVPALFRFSDADQIVRASAIREFADQYKGPVTLQVVEPGPGIDANAHVLAGDIVSPAMTDTTVKDLMNWIKGL